MAVDEFLIDRLRNALMERNSVWLEKKMFGGICFMVDEKMCFGSFRDGLMVRIDPESVEDLLLKEHTEQMMQRERIMKGYLMINSNGYDTDEELEFWIDRCLAWNPQANKSKKRKSRGKKT